MTTEDVSGQNPEPNRQEIEGIDALDVALSESIGALSRLSAAHLGLEQTLIRVAQLAVRAIPGADGAGLTLIEQDRADTVVSTHPFVIEIDDIQYEIGQGPCISAAAEGRTLISASLGNDPRWPKFGSQAARKGVHSVVSLPLLTPDGVKGSMNVYAYAKNVFDERAAALGELFAEPAAVAVENAQILGQSQRLTQHLQTALEQRGVVDRAVGIMMSRSGGTPEQALERLRRLSQSEHLKLAAVAQNLVDEAVRRVLALQQEPAARSDPEKSVDQG